MFGRPYVNLSVILINVPSFFGKKGNLHLQILDPNRMASLQSAIAAGVTPPAAAVLASEEAAWPLELEALTTRLRKNNLPHQIAAVKTCEGKVR